MPFVLLNSIILELLVWNCVTDVHTARHFFLSQFRYELRDPFSAQCDCSLRISEARIVQSALFGFGMRALVTILCEPTHWAPGYGALVYGLVRVHQNLSTFVWVSFEVVSVGVQMI